MSSLKNGLIGGIGKAAHLSSIEWLMGMSGQKLILPMYHLVTDEIPAHIRHLYRPNGVEEFKSNLDWLLKHFQPLDLDQLKQLVKGEMQLRKPSFFLSFDDGLREFGEIAAPILERKGIPAACFLNSSFLDNKGLMFRYKVSLLIDKVQQDPSCLKNSRVLEYLSDKAIKPERFKEELLTFRYRHDHDLDELADIIGVGFKQYLEEDRPYLETSEIHALISKGFYFGGHSIDHPEYQDIDPKAQFDQTLQSVNAIQNLFELDYRIFAFPFTDYGVGKQLIREMHSDKMKIDLSFGVAGLKKDILPQHLQRIPMEKDHHSAEHIIKTEMAYYLSKAPFGKNEIHRT